MVEAYTSMARQWEARECEECADQQRRDRGDEDVFEQVTEQTIARQG
jgi:hypothetical protein